MLKRYFILGDKETRQTRSHGGIRTLQVIKSLLNRLDDVTPASSLSEGPIPQNSAETRLHRASIRLTIRAV